MNIIRLENRIRSCHNCIWVRDSQTRARYVIPPDSKIASWHTDRRHFRPRDNLSLETTLAFVLFSRPEVSGGWYNIYSNLRPVVPRDSGVAMASPDFSRSVNPISTKEGRLCSPNNTGTPGFPDLAKALNLKTFVMSSPILTGNLNENPQFATKSLKFASIWGFNQSTTEREWDKTHQQNCWNKRANRMLSTSWISKQTNSILTSLLCLVMQIVT